ncbi:hypothetical protein C9994_06735 [Marivirga lumbricoides]|uniref:Uncharacterized protein n=1 Tax=Marivirga lumbricoides TaxID=1046115 RepID=A0A2T4DS06_9BACT|nr:hypothetical protein C9994_06735 [Marivirga lumbricoides]
MDLSEVKSALSDLKQVIFELPDGTTVPEHFHITEIGLITKKFIDCGGSLRNDRIINFQLLEAQDYDHRLSVKKLYDIIIFSEEKLGLSDELEVEVEYEMQTIGKYGLNFSNERFLLTVKQADCLAKDQCGLPSVKVNKPRLKLADMTASSGNLCTPDGGCCQ